MAHVIFLVLLLAGSPMSGKHVITIYFLCDTGPSAVLVATEGLWDTDEMPDDCRMIEPVKPINFAEVQEHFAWVITPDGRLAKVARVLRENYEYGYSAGFTDLLLM